MLLDVVERLANDLQQLERDLRLGRLQKLGADEVRGYAAVLLKLFHHAPERRVETALHVHRPHAADKSAQLIDLRLAQLLQSAPALRWPPSCRRVRSLRMISSRIWKLMKLCSGPS